MRRELLILFLGVIMILAISSFRATHKDPCILAGEHYTNQFQSLKMASAVWLEEIKQNPENPKLHVYYSLRDAFKRCEFIWEFQDPNFVKEYINGAPLPKLDKSAPNLTILEPKGLQVLDELLNSSDRDPAELISISEELHLAIDQQRPGTKLYDRIIFDAIRIGLVRHFTLGLSGFDLPGSDRALEDGQVLIREMQVYLNFYRKDIQQKDRTLAQNIDAFFDEALRRLERGNFGNFDRLEYLKEVVNPLLKQLEQARLLLEIESINESAPGTQFAVNFSSTGLFNPDFLNPLYYVSFPGHYYNPRVIELGKTLFFDPILSLNVERSCASCHKPELGFSDGIKQSIAFDFEGHLDRNSPGLINAVYSERFFHDLRAEAFEDQIEHVIVNEKEFNHTMLGILERLKQSPEYLTYFKEAFPEHPNALNQQNLSFAISAYVASLQSFNSPFDRYVRKEITMIEPAVSRGFNLFMGKASCGTCHFAPVFNGTVPPFYTESESEVLGVPESTATINPKLDPDPGRYNAKLKERAPFYKHSFKTPGLRNVGITAPYMHNGVFRSLEEVMDFYNKGGGIGMGIDVPHQTLPSEPLELNEQEVQDIIAFLRSLTDTSFSQTAIKTLPFFPDNETFNLRKIGGTY